MEHPRLWWPNGLGSQPLYTLKAAALTGGKTEDEKTLRLGLRTMTVSRKKDEWGESFALCCNGVDFFAMGGDYIPEDNLLTRVTRERTEQLLRDCRDCHFNTSGSGAAASIRTTTSSTCATRWAWWSGRT